MTRNSSQPCLLLVEDDSDDITLARHGLGQSGLGNRPELACNARATLRRFEHWQQGGRLPQVIVLDLRRTDGYGLDLLRQIKQHAIGRTIPVVVFQDSCAERDVRAAYARGACSYVKKPRRFEQYVRTLADLAAYWCRLNQTYAASLR